MDQDNHTITARIATAITIVSRSEERLNARGSGQCFGDPFINPVSKFLVSPSLPFYEQLFKNVCKFAKPLKGSPRMIQRRRDQIVRYS